MPREERHFFTCVEVAAYRIAIEALANVTRHAQATTCKIRLDVTDDTLIVEVQDDGVGLPPGYHAGVGISAMRERATELGGTCVVETVATGGTRVYAAQRFSRLDGPRTRNIRDDRFRAQQCRDCRRTGAQSEDGDGPG